MVTTTHVESHAAGGMFDPEEQQAWKNSQIKLQEAAKISQIGQAKFQKADDHLSHAEAAQRDADEAARHHAGLKGEAQKHLDAIEGLKSQQPQLHDAHAAAGRTAEEKAALAQQAQRELQQAERAAHDKEHHLAGLKPQLEQHHAHHAHLEDQLAHHRHLTAQHEEAHRARQHEHDALRKQHEHNILEVERLDKEHAPLRQRKLELEKELAALHDHHGHGERALLAAKEKANQSHTRLHGYDPSEHNKALEALQLHKKREAELAAELAAAKDHAHHHQDLHERALADHKAALEHYNLVRGKVTPIQKEVDDARLAQDHAHSKLAELEAEARRRHGVYRQHLDASKEHGNRAAELQALADKHAKGYHAMRREGDDALAQKEQLWTEAKTHGDGGVTHFKEKVGTMQARLDKVGTKIKDALTPGKDSDATVTDRGLEGHSHNGHTTTHSEHVSHGGVNPTGQTTTEHHTGTATGLNPTSHTTHSESHSGNIAPATPAPAQEAVDDTATTKPEKKTGLKGLFSRVSHT